MLSMTAGGAGLSAQTQGSPQIAIDADEVVKDPRVSGLYTHDVWSKIHGHCCDQKREARWHRSFGTRIHAGGHLNENGNNHLSLSTHERTKLMNILFGFS
jgi:hypothetical protein